MYGDPAVSTPRRTKAPFVLAADDSSADRRLLGLAFAELDEPCRLHVVADGHVALDFLRDPGAERPDLVLVDLNMPGLHGLDLVAQIKTDPVLQTIPVVVLTTSSTLTDRTAAYERHANAFLRKPVDLDEFFLLIRSLYEFWLVRAELP